MRGYSATEAGAALTTVMNAVGERHAGVASGINNAVARTAGLVAVAVLGVVVTGVFARRFDSRLAALSLPDSVRAELSSQAGRLAAVETPAGLSDDARLAVVRAVEESFDGGFRAVVLVCAALSLSGALCAWLLIEDNAPSADGGAQE